MAGLYLMLLLVLLAMLIRVLTSVVAVIFILVLLVKIGLLPALLVPVRIVFHRQLVNRMALAQTLVLLSSSTGWYSHAKGSDITGNYCNGGCEVTLSGDLSTPEYFETSTTLWRSFSRSVTGTVCSSSNPSPSESPTPPNTPDKPVPCAAGEGVISNSAGKVKCVSGSLPGADVPKINKTTSTETNSDGSTKITTNIQTCTGAGACSTSSTTTITGATGGGAGMAGTPGTSTTATDKPKSETSDFCAQNPNLQMCKGGMNEEATQKQVRDEIKKLTTPDFSDDSAIKSATHSPESQTELEAENAKTTLAATGQVDPTASTKSSWALAMETGWFGSIPASSCAPFVSSFGGKTWTLDICPTAAKISEWGSWAWGLLAAFAVWAMVTRGNA
jgi:hypothetical protein